MSSFTDFLKVQRYFAAALLSDPFLNNINIITRDELIESESKLPDKTLALEVLAYITPRNGRKGCGIIVEKPEFRVEKPNLPGPQGELILTCLIVSERMLNYGPQTGTLLPASQVGQRILEIGHNFRIRPAGALFADVNALTEARDFEPLDAWRATLKMALPRKTADRVAEPVITAAGLEVTITSATSEAEIFYTLDESAPSRVGSRAVRYEAPFTVESGTIVTAAAYRSDLLQSNITTETIA